MQHYSHHPHDPLEIAHARPDGWIEMRKNARFTVSMVVACVALGLGLLSAISCYTLTWRVAALEHTVEVGLGSEWPVLTEAQSKRLSDALKGITQPKTLIVMYHNPLGLALSESIADAFRKGGWHDVVVIPGIVAEPGLGTGHLTGMAGTLKKVIEDATGYKLVSYGPENEQGLLFVAVGVKR